MESTSGSTYTNGHFSPLASHVVTNEDAPYDTDSDLSDIREPPVAQPTSPSTSSSPEQQSEFGHQDLDSEESSEAENENASEDGDFDVEDSPATGVDTSTRVDRSQSFDSRRAPKRKLGFEDDEHIMANPELYGLRRSGRPVQHRPIIESDDEDEDNDNDNDSGSDIQPRKRRKAERSRPVSKRETPTVRSTSDNSGSEDYGGARARINAKKQRRRQVESGVVPAARWSNRRAAQVTAGAYQESDAELEDESDTMTPNYWATDAAAETSPYIDVVLKHRLQDGLEMAKTDLSRDDFEYYIKWQGKSHHHATWETTASVAGFRGTKKIENYYRKIVAEDIYMAIGPDVPPEEKEKWMLDRERDADALLDYTKVERVIGVQDGDEGTEYYIKWKGLYYDSCTWETGELISEIAQGEIDRFLDRISRSFSSNRAESNPSTRAPHVHLREQPSYIKNGQLRDFQITGLNFMAYNWTKNNNVILADEMGLGKTVQTVSFMSWLRHSRGQEGPFLVVVPLTTMPAWADTFDHWTPDVNYVVYNGKESSRSIIREYELLTNGDVRKPKFNVLLTSYEYILQDAAFLSQVKWQFMAVDEAHRLKNRDSQLYQKLLEFKAPSRLLITGTPVQNTLGELSALMDFLMPGKVVIEDGLDLESEDAGAKIETLTKAIQPFILRRTKQKVENDLPPKSEKIIRVELSDVQLEYYKNILTRNYAALNEGSKGQKQSLLNIMMELKKASNHPYMFPNAEDKIVKGSERREDLLKGLIASSGKMMLLDRLLTKLKKDGHRVLIFSQMVKMLDILGDYLQLRGHQFQRLDGTIAAGPRRMAIDHFNADGSDDFCFLLSTRAGGLGINLMTADTVIIFDSDWNPQADLQAMARAHRIGQKKPVSIYRLVSKETVEEEILERARNKLMLEFITIQRGVTDKEKKELRDKAVKAGKIEDPRSSEDISRILKRRGQKMFEQSGNQKKLEELDIDSVLENAEEHKTEVPEGMIADGGEDFLRSFEYTDVKIDLEWDDIIPKDQLATIKAEEEKKANEAYLARIVEENKPRGASMKSSTEAEREQRLAKKRERELLKERELAEKLEAKSDPKRELNEKEARYLIKAYLRYGSIDDRPDELIKDARLVGRDIDLIRKTLQDITDESQRLLKDDAARIEAMERESNKVLTKKDKKAVLFDFLGVKRLNAETVVERPGEMRMLKEVIGAHNDYHNFRVPDASKGAHYSCEWGAKEDGMLLVGIHRHGYGAWVDIRDDPGLGLGDKLFLEEHRVDKKEERTKGEDKTAKAPGAVHLVRRADYLMSVLKAKYSNDTAAKRAVENHHRNNKKGRDSNGVRRSDSRASVSASPVPHMKKLHRQPEVRSRDRASHSEDRNGDSHRHDGHRHSHGGNDKRKGELKRKHSRPDDESRHDRHKKPKHIERSIDEIEAENTNMVKAHFRSSDKASVVIDRISSLTKVNVPSKKDRAAELTKELVKIGDFIVESTGELGGLVPLFWEHVSQAWPTPMPGSQLAAAYKAVKVRQAETKAAAARNGIQADEPPKVPNVSAPSVPSAVTT